jgi:hypothetical protein
VRRIEEGEGEGGPLRKAHARGEADVFQTRLGGGGSSGWLLKQKPRKHFRGGNYITMDFLFGTEKIDFSYQQHFIISNSFSHFLASERTDAL